jgi:hypothetical protein
MALIVLGTLATGCSSYAVAKYGVSVENVSTLRALGDEKINVGAFGAAKPGQTAIMCRAVGPVRTPDGGPFEEYIRKALIDELRVAGAFSDAAPVTLTGHLDKLEFSSTSGQWVFGLTVSSSSGKSLTLADTYDYETSFVGEKACALTAQAFGPAVQHLIGKLVKSPEFATLLR